MIISNTVLLLTQILLAFHQKFLKLYGIHYFENIMDTGKFCSTRSREKGRLYSQFIESFILTFLFLYSLQLSFLVIVLFGSLQRRKVSASIWQKLFPQLKQFSFDKLHEYLRRRKKKQKRKEKKSTFVTY